MHELGLRLRVLADDLAFFGEVDFDFQVFQCHAIAEVAVQPVRLLHDGRAARSIFAEETRLPGEPSCMARSHSSSNRTIWRRERRSALSRFSLPVARCISSVRERSRVCVQRVSSFCPAEGLKDSANCLKKSWGRSNTTRRKTSRRGEAVLLRTPNCVGRGFMIAMRSW